MRRRKYDDEVKVEKIPRRKKHDEYSKVSKGKKKGKGKR